MASHFKPFSVVVSVDQLDFPEAIKQSSALNLNGLSDSDIEAIELAQRAVREIELPGGDALRCAWPECGTKENA